MRLVALRSGECPCFLLRFRKVNVLLDCGLDFQTVFESFDVSGRLEVDIPEPDFIDFATIDVILVSNYHNMLALPFITEYFGFKGKVYATEPTATTARQFMEELVKVNCTPTGGSRPDGVRLPSSDVAKSATCQRRRKLYTMNDVEACMQRVHPLSYSQRIPVLSAFDVTPVSSGFALGSANWVIQTPYEKLVYVAQSSAATARHPEPFNTQALRDASVLLFSGLCL
eukprot:TRINITY_DN7252_c0_g1_i1.p1 TRINITY_DN7252_c0_g1~~TRINITY_DN7252_c0_g1_i1.p1  ORF type:complete len:227 (-),score=60.97 TRINITY_DN7252_c0_g1_i1:236-916(-)